MKKISTLLFLLFFAISFSQIKGSVNDNKGNPIAFANIYVKDTYISTTSNELGKFELNLKKTGNFTILFQYLGYKTHKEIVNFENNLITLSIVLEEEDLQLNEVVINTKENPANAIIKKAIANRKENSKKADKYKADFYSRGIFRVKDLPKSILGQKIDMFDEVIDSTRSGILYLSETVSKITFQKPDKMKEVIIASKVSGNDNGFSFNNAADVNFDFYENYLDFDVKVISPIADGAFNYYKYKIDGSFFDENNQLIYKIKVNPKRETEPAMNGFIYIVDDSFAIYGIDLAIKGSQMQNPALNNLALKQNFSYNTITKTWIKNTQTIEFSAGLLGFNFSGKFTHVYSNFEFPEKFEKKTFTREVLKFEENANKKEDAFWETIRPVPLTLEESTDYFKKDALQEKKKSQKYLDSIDAKRNKFGLADVIMGYSYNNSFKKWSVNYDGFLMNTSFNTVQGWNTHTGISYGTRNEEKRTYSRIGSNFDYGLSEKKLRVSGYYFSKFNNKNNSILSINVGSTINQFNATNPISKNINSVSSLAFKNNFMKLYEKNAVAINFGREIINGLNLNINAEYAERKQLFNTTNFASVKTDDVYSSNNPLAPNDFITPTFDKHNLFKTSLVARIKFGQKYWTRPDGKFNIGNNKYPNISIGYEKAFAATDKKYEFDLLSTRITKDFTLGNKGDMQLNFKAGKFFNANNIAFVDYKHFNGNQTHIGQTDSYTNVFNLLPYYVASTNDSYLEFHAEHNDRGFLMNKIPLLNKLKSQLVLGFHNLAIPDRKPYQEFSVGLDNLGFGKFRLFRLDYVRSYQNGFVTDGVVFGLKFLNVLE
ncbi:DUF5686 and carboxypeptidase regulatory-like domain-containing protein [Flavobacterium sp.]|uniref:DUF5686 and carboxypeptidase regulatory-like domain-containing protein n=1 Tax=Flavobacterium sp. TaxID=239 RepID=UPI00375041FD